MYKLYVVPECNSHLTPFPFYLNRLPNFCMKQIFADVTALDAILN